MKYITLALIFAVTYGVPYADITLVSMMSGLSVLYYVIVFRVMSGLKSSKYNSTYEELRNFTLGSLSKIVATVAIIMHTDYAIFGYFILPWVSINTITNLMGWAIHFGIIEIKNKEDV